ncbi:hypothetical protein BXZ70DRAFT_1065729, partial [Cristinia sonorae]
MPKCWCNSNKCNGKSVPHDTARAHRISDSRNHSHKAQIITRVTALPQATTGHIPRSLNEQVIHPFPDLSSVPTVSSRNSVEQQMLEHGTMIASDMYLDHPHLPHLPSVPDHLDPAALLLACVEHHTQYNATVEANSPRLTSYLAHSAPIIDEEERHFLRAYQDALEDPHYQIISQSEPAEPDIDDELFLPDAPVVQQEIQDMPPLADDDDSDNEDDGDDIHAESTGFDGLSAEDLAYIDSIPVQSLPSPATLDLATLSPADVIPLVYHENSDITGESTNTSDDPDPFFKSSDLAHSPPSLFFSQPEHLQLVYGAVSWARQHSHVSRAACVILLLAFSLVISLLSPNAAKPLLSMQSMNLVLPLSGSKLRVLSVCYNCKEVYPDSDDSPTCCTNCHTELYKPSKTTRGSTRNTRIPWLKYPYMSLSAQLGTMLTIPGFEEMMDEWKTKDRQPEVYQDIFDGAVS